MLKLRSIEPKVHKTHVFPNIQNKLNTNNVHLQTHAHTNIKSLIYYATYDIAQHTLPK